MAGDLNLLLPRPHNVDLNAGAPCLAFLNSTDQPDGFSHRDDLQPGYANVLSWALAAGVIDDADTRRLLGIARRNAREASAIRRRILEFRGTLLRLVRCMLANKTPDQSDLSAFEREFRDTYAHASLVMNPETGALIWEWPEDIRLEQPLWSIVRSAEEILFSERRDRIRECASDDCQRMFLDTSRNRSRRYCSTAVCGNRERVRKFRQEPSD